MGAPRHRLRRTLDALSSAAPVAPAAVATSSDVPYPAFRVAPRFVSDARLLFFSSGALHLLRMDAWMVFRPAIQSCTELMLV